MTDIGLELVDPIYYAQHGYPHAQWSELRATAPLRFFEPEGYQGYWAVTKHADICEVSKQPNCSRTSRGSP